MAVNLRRLGWDVTVLTVDEKQWAMRDASIDYASEPVIQRIESRVRLAVLAAPQFKVPWYIPRIVTRTAAKLPAILDIDPECGWAIGTGPVLRNLRPGDADVVFVSAPPFSSVGVAARAAERLECPFVIDYRDLWTMNPMVANMPSKRQSRLEGQYTARASAITVIGRSAAQSLVDGFGLAGKVHVVTNGYNATELTAVEPRRFESFAIVYTGTFYAARRPDPLVRALAAIQSRGMIGREWHFHYFGPNGDVIRRASDAVGLPRDCIVDHGVVSRGEALAATAGADVVAVVTTSRVEPKAGDLGIVTGKIFEAIGLRRQMVVIAPDGSDVEAIIAEAGLGRTIPAAKPEMIAETIAACADGKSVEPRNPAAFDWSNIAPRLSSILIKAAGL